MNQILKGEFTMKQINQTYELNATSQVVFDALVNPETIKQWSGAPAQMDGNIGTKFSLFGGQIEGTNLEVVPNQKLVQKWPSDTKVTITLVDNGDTTTADLLHEDIPADEVEKFSQGWKEYYFGPMQKMFAG